MPCRLLLNLSACLSLGSGDARVVAGFLDRAERTAREGRGKEEGWKEDTHWLWIPRKRRPSKEGKRRWNHGQKESAWRTTRWRDGPEIRGHVVTCDVCSIFIFLDCHSIACFQQLICAKIFIESLSLNFLGTSLLLCVQTSYVRTCPLHCKITLPLRLLSCQSLYHAILSMQLHVVCFLPARTYFSSYCHTGEIF